MARTARRVNSGSDRKQLQMTFEEGNAVRKLSALPEEEPERRPRKSHRQLQRNRARAKNIGAGYITVLTLICVMTLGLCVHYLKIKTTLTTQTETIAEKESELSDLKSENDAYYNQTISSVTLDDVKNAALNRLGMHYATESQIQYFSIGDGSYVRQYQDVPEEADE